MSVGAPVIAKIAIVTAECADINKTIKKDLVTKMSVTQISGCLKNSISLPGWLQAQKERNFFPVKNFFPVGLFQYSSQLM